MLEPRIPEDWVPVTDKKLHDLVQMSGEVATFNEDECPIYWDPDTEGYIFLQLVRPLFYGRMPMRDNFHPLYDARTVRCGQTPFRTIAPLRAVCIRGAGVTMPADGSVPASFYDRLDITGNYMSDRGTTCAYAAQVTVGRWQEGLSCNLTGVYRSFA